MIFGKEKLRQAHLKFISQCTANILLHIPDKYFRFLATYLNILDFLSSPFKTPSSLFHPKKQGAAFLHISQFFFIQYIFSINDFYLCWGFFYVYYHALKLLEEQTNKDTWKAVLLLMSFVATYTVMFVHDEMPSG